MAANLGGLLLGRTAVAIIPFICDGDFPSNDESSDVVVVVGAVAVGTIAPCDIDDSVDCPVVAQLGNGDDITVRPTTS